MGNHESRVQIVEDNLEQLKTIQSPIYGEAQVVKNKNTNQILACKQIYCSSEEELQHLRLQIKETKKINSVFIVKIINDYVEENTGLCHQGANATIYFEYISNDIKQIIQEQQKENQNMIEHFIIQMINDVSLALTELKSHQTFHKNIQPKTILFDDSGKFKISNINFIIQQDNYQNLLHQTDLPKDCFISPELLIELGKQCQQPLVDLEKSEVFSLGLVALAMSQNELSMHTLYDFNNFQFKKNQLDQKLEQLNIHFSDKFIALLNKLLDINPKSRIDLQTTSKMCQNLLQNNPQHQLSFQNDNFQIKPVSITPRNNLNQNLNKNYDLPLKLEEFKHSQNKQNQNDSQASEYNQFTSSPINDNVNDLNFKGRTSGKILKRNNDEYQFDRNQGQGLRKSKVVETYSKQFYYPKRYTLQHSHPVMDVSLLEKTNSRQQSYRDYGNQNTEYQQKQSSRAYNDPNLITCLTKVEQLYNNAILESQKRKSKAHKAGINNFSNQLTENQDYSQYQQYLYPQTTKNLQQLQSSSVLKSYQYKEKKQIKQIDYNQEKNEKSQSKGRWKF